jgi:hypothetical protein
VDLVDETLVLELLPLQFSALAFGPLDQTAELVRLGQERLFRLGQLGQSGPVTAQDGLLVIGQDGFCARPPGR